MNKERKKRLEKIQDELEEIIDEESESRDNLEEHFPCSEKVEQMDTTIDLLEDVISGIQEIIDNT
jgi:superfamily I DNA and/or RNA helicase